MRARCVFEQVGEAYAVCAKFSVSIGFHSGSGKSAENYEVCGRATGGNLEIKTSGRYTYEMGECATAVQGNHARTAPGLTTRAVCGTVAGRALFASSDPTDQQLWSDWYAWTTEIALNSCFRCFTVSPPPLRPLTVPSHPVARAAGAQQTDVRGGPRSENAEQQKMARYKSHTSNA